MLINVPQYIDVEDKVAGPLTAKQLVWLIALGVILLILWNVVSKPVFFISGIPLAILFISLSFFRPYGQPLISFFMFGILYYFRPKIYVWKRDPEKNVAKKVIQIQKAPESRKQLTPEELAGLSRLLDSEGQQYDENVKKILEQNRLTKK